MIRVRIVAKGGIWARGYGALHPPRELDVPDHLAIAWTRAVPPIAETVVPDAGPVDDPRWEFRIPPERYLQRFPKGRGAPLARQIMEAR